MPPKKANTKAKATPAKGKAAAVTEPPATVTTSRGKEYETTAAAARPRRASTASVDKPAPAVKNAAPAKKATKAAPKATKATTTTTTPAAGKKRGRPAKAAAEEAEDQPPKKRGRPANGATKATLEAAVAEPPKKKSGRPAKVTPAVPREEDAPPKKKGGRPAKVAPAVPLREEDAPPKKRGRPPRGEPTTEVTVADEAAAEQLEEELVENAEAETGEGISKRTSPTKKKRGRPAKAKGKGKSAVIEVTAEEEEDEEKVVDEEEAAETNGENVKRYWLMKAEQEDREETLSDGSVFNAKFTIDDLRAKGGPEPWDGVRNPTACKNMKDMKLGDLAFFYASGGKKGNVPGITGIMEVVKESEPDPGAFDENNPYYVKNAKMRGSEEKPRWFMVHVEFRKKLSTPVTLKELQKYAKGEGVLAKMQEFTTARLSVSKVTEEEWDFIVDNLIDDYEEDEALPAPSTGDDTPMADVDTKLPNGVKQTIESEAPTTDTLLTTNTAPTSRPGSHAGSRAGSVSRTNGIKKPASRSGSLQPPRIRAGSRSGSLQPPLARSVSRGRSRTPNPRAGSMQPMLTLEEEET